MTITKYWLPGLAHLDSLTSRTWRIVPRPKRGYHVNNKDFRELADVKRVVHSGGTLSATSVTYIGLKRKVSIYMHLLPRKYHNYIIYLLRSA